MVVELTPLARQRIEELYGPVGTEGLQLLNCYDDDELRFLSAFLRDGITLQVKHASLIRAGGIPRDEALAEESGDS